MLCTRALFFALLAQGSLAHLRTDNVQARDSGEPGEIRRTEYPPTASHLEDNKIVMDAISTDRMRNSMETLTHWNNRHYKTPSGVAASDWIFEKIKRYHGTFKISRKKHDWPQRSIDVQISEGTGQRRKDKRVIVVGAHLDSISYGDGRTADATAGAEAPGADDNASGVAVLLEALYLVLRDQRAKHFRNQVHFHFYAAEEAGLLGSKDVFQQYEKEGFDVIAVLNQDMAGRKVSEGEDIFTVVRDQFTYQPLNDFLVKVIKTVSSSLFLFLQNLKGLNGADVHGSTRTSGRRGGLVAAPAPTTPRPRGVASLRRSSRTV